MSVCILKPFLSYRIFFPRVFDNVLNTTGKGGGGAVEVNNRESSSNALKAKTTKAERREMQEAQRAAKAAGKGSKVIFMFLVFEAKFC